MEALLIVGMEGFWGTLITIALMAAAQLIPGDDVGGVFENTKDSFDLIASSTALQIVLIVQLFSAFSYNYAGMSVTGNFSAIFRTVLETMRTLGVWTVDLLLFAFHVAGLGERWTSYSFIQAAGFILL